MRCFSDGRRINLLVVLIAVIAFTYNQIQGLIRCGWIGLSIVLSAVLRVY